MKHINIIIILLSFFILSCEENYRTLEGLKDGRCETSDDCKDKEVCNDNRCILELSKCASNPCKNGGECSLLEDSYICDCNDTGYKGENCEIEIKCASNPCKNGGICTNEEQSYSCNCENINYQGKNCEILVNEYCSPNPCKNGGICVDKLNSYECNCEGTNYQGDNCEIKINYCESNPCKNGGVCIDGEDSYSCNCEEIGYIGDNCEVDIDECSENNGNCEQICNNKVGSFECSCNDNFVLNIDNFSCDKLFTEFGTSQWDEGLSIINDSEGNLYITGFTRGNLYGEQNTTGKRDIFLTKFDKDNNQIWKRQFGTPEVDRGDAIAIDSENNIYIVGQTDGALNGNTHIGDIDVFLIKIDKFGNTIWTKQFGSIAEDKAYELDIDDDNNIYITGATLGTLRGNVSSGGKDIFLAKYNSNGNQIWLKQLGSAEWDKGTSVKVYQNKIYLMGYTGGILEAGNHLGGIDVFIAKYNSDGYQIWLKQLGTEKEDTPKSMDIKNDHIYITGILKEVEDYDIFLMKTDVDGQMIWNKKFGTLETEGSEDLIVDEDENIYITGYTVGDFEVNYGYSDIFLLKISSNGMLIRANQWGTETGDYAQSIAYDNNYIYITGNSLGALPGNEHLGQEDIFFMKLKKE